MGWWVAASLAETTTQFERKRERDREKDGLLERERKTELHEFNERARERETERERERRREDDARGGCFSFLLRATQCLDTQFEGRHLANNVGVGLAACPGYFSSF